MTNLKRGTVLAGLAIITLLAVLPFTVCAETPTVKPSVPEFTLEVVDFSYDVPARNETDIYTGEVRTISGYHVENKTIKLSVKNQETNFTIDGKKCQMYLAIRQKPHYGTEWTQTGSNITLEASPGRYGQFISIDCARQSNSEYTVFWYLGDWAPNTTMDFQVQALCGHDTQRYLPLDAETMMAGLPFSYRYSEYKDAIACDGKSDWSEVQSITIPPNPTAAPEATPEPTAQSGFDWTWENTKTAFDGVSVLLPSVIINGTLDVLEGFGWEKAALTVTTVLIVVLALGMIVLWRRTSKLMKTNHQLG